jgi:hypothetical protein
VSTWPGADLVSARSIERILRRQRTALTVLAATAGAGLVLAGTNRMLVIVAIAAAAGMVLISATGVYERDRGNLSADALIESGFRYEGREDAVSRAVADRVAALESDRTRRGLAGALRAHMELGRLRGLAEQSEVVEGGVRPPARHHPRGAAAHDAVCCHAGRRGAGGARPAAARHCGTPEDGDVNGTEGETRMEVRQAAKIVATTCVVTFTVVLAALLMVR